MELADHRCVLVLHDHQANPHVHVGMKAESKHSLRLNPRKADLHHCRKVFAKRLRKWGVDAEANHQPLRGEQPNHADLWRGKPSRTGSAACVDGGVVPGRARPGLEAAKQIYRPDAESFSSPSFRGVEPPHHGALIQSNKWGKHYLSKHAIARRAAKAGHARDGVHVQKRRDKQVSVCGSRGVLVMHAEALCEHTEPSVAGACAARTSDFDGKLLVD